VQALMPDAVTRGSDGYLRVIYDKLGLKFRTYRKKAGWQFDTAADELLRPTTPRTKRNRRVAEKRLCDCLHLRSKSEVPVQIMGTMGP
jgi:hypothetical protein